MLVDVGLLVLKNRLVAHLIIVVLFPVIVGSVWSGEGEFLSSLSTFSDAFLGTKLPWLLSSAFAPWFTLQSCFRQELQGGLLAFS